MGLISNFSVVILEKTRLNITISITREKSSFSLGNKIFLVFQSNTKSKSVFLLNLVEIHVA